MKSPEAETGKDGSMVEVDGDVAVAGEDEGDDDEGRVG